ncbi:bifunctional lysylphosphatidylglycerol flippase/synthetase MprF [bacterium]|nr:bifunctional lysylphosphatidylglycerol flippase/synthetase MprF [bacterium]
MTETATVSTEHPVSIGRLYRWLPSMLGVLMMVLAIIVLHHSLHDIQFSDVAAHLSSIGLSHLVFALALTVCSYLLLTLYDVLALHYVQFPMRWRELAPTAFSAYAVGHNVGFASLSGGAIRYRAYSAAGLDSPRIATVIIFGTSTFFLGAGLSLGIASVAEPVTMLQALPLPTGLVRVLGYTLIVVVIAYLFWSRMPKANLKFGSWTLSPPGLSIAGLQLMLGVADLVVASLVIYVLMPSDISLGYLPFLGIYLICLGVALISNVPGGIGVFEGSMLLLLPQIAKPELLGALLAYRVIYYLIPMAMALLVLGVQIGIERRTEAKAVVAQSTLILTRAAPQIISTTVFVAGAVLLFSGSLPSEIERVRFISSLVPEAVLQISHILGSVVGLMLLILARGLYRRLEGAFWLTLGALGIGIAASLFKGFDVEEAIVLCIAGFILWVGRSHFNRKASLLEEPFTGGWLLSIMMVVAGSVWLGFFSYRHVDYSNSLWWNFAVDRDAPKMLRASFAVVLALTAFALSRILRASDKSSAPATNADMQLAASIVPNGSSADANVALTGDKRFLFHRHNDAFIMYQLSGRSVIAMGDPVGNSQNFAELIWSFRELCDKLDKRCVFYQASSSYLPLYIDLGLSFSKLGEEAMVPLHDFSLQGKKREKFRQARNRAQREGASFEIIPAARVAPLLPELRQVSDSWLQSKNVKEKGFSVGAFNDDYLQRFDVGIVKVDGAIVAFANLWPAGDKSVLSIDLMRHSDAAPKGIMDYLFTELMLWGKNSGYAFFSLGMAPLSGLEHHPLATLWNKIGNLIFQLGDEFYNFEGLRFFKQKFAPEWEPRYLASRGGLALPSVMIDATTLISGGVKGVFSK